MLVGSFIFPGQTIAITLPLYLGAVAILASTMASFFVKLGKNKNIMSAFYKGLLAAALLSAFGFLWIIRIYVDWSPVPDNPHVS